MNSGFGADRRYIRRRIWFALLLGFWPGVALAEQPEATNANGTPPVAPKDASPATDPVTPPPTTATAAPPSAPQTAAPVLAVATPRPPQTAAPVPATAAGAESPISVVVDGGDATAELSLDGAPVGRGTWRGRLPSGRHRMEITRDGYPPQQFELSSDRHDAITLVPIWRQAAPPKSRGLFVRFDISGLTGPKADQISMDCPTASACNSKGPWGAGGDVRVGFALKPWLAPEITLLGFIDATNITSTFDTPSTYRESRFYGPSRTENYTFLRYGWMLGVGGRVRTPTSPVQGTLGLSLGVAATTAQFTKIGVTTGKMSQNPTEALLPEEQHRTSASQTLYNPAVLLDAAAMLTGGDGFRLYLGALLLATFSDRQIRLAGENSSLGSNPATGVGTPYGMPNVTASRKTSIYFGPTLGFHFGN